MPMSSIFTEGGGSLLNNIFSGSPVSLICTLLPHHDWLPWKFYSVGRFFDKIHNHQRFFLYIRKKMQFQTCEDWHSITFERIKKEGGGYLLDRFYSSSLYLFLLSRSPSEDWREWRFSPFWERKWTFPVRHEFFYWLGTQLDYICEEDWYSFSFRDIRQYLFHPDPLISLYKSSIWDFITTHIPHHRWDGWRMTEKPRGLWSSLKNRQRFFWWLVRRKLECKVPSDFVELKQERIIENGGKALLRKYYDASASQFIINHFPETDWSDIFWEKSACNTLESQKKLLQVIIQDKGLSIPQHWYGITRKDVTVYFVTLVNRRFNGVQGLIQTLLPEMLWIKWKFQLPRGMWRDKRTHSDFFNYIKQEWRIENEWEWARPSLLDYIRTTGICAYYQRFSPLLFILTQLGKDVGEMEEFVRNSVKKTQGFLVGSLGKIYSQTNVLEEQVLDGKQSLDALVPEYAIAYEYQGIQHVVEAGGIFQVISDIRK